MRPRLMGDDMGPSKVTLAAASIAFGLVAVSTQAQARLMTVGDLQNLIDKGPKGEAAAVAFVQGTVEGLLGMDSMLQKEQDTDPAFCGVADLKAEGRSMPRVASHTKQLVAAWKQQGVKPMSTPAVDMVVAYLEGQYGCGR